MYIQNFLNIPTKKTTIRFIPNILMLFHIIQKLTRQSQLNIKNIYI